MSDGKVKALRLPSILCLLVLLFVACSSERTSDTIPAVRVTGEEWTEEGAIAPSKVAAIASPTSTPVPTMTTTTIQTSTVAPTTTGGRTPTLILTSVPSATSTPTPLTVTDEVTFELVAQKGGRVHAVSVAENIAYVGEGPRLVALDVTDPVAPQPIGRSEVLPGIVEAVVVVHEDEAVRAYVGAGNHAIVLRLGPGGEIALQGTAELPGRATELALGQSVLYIAGELSSEMYPGTGFVAALNVQEPDLPPLLDTVTLPAAVSSVALAEEVLYVGHYGSQPSRLSVLPLGSHAAEGGDEGTLGEPSTIELDRNELYSLTVAGETLLAGGFSTIIAFDIREPFQPEQVWQIDGAADEPFGMVEGVAFAEGLIYATGSVPAGDYIPFRLAIRPPVAVQGQPGSPASSDALVAGGRLFVAEGGELEIYRLGEMGELVLAGEYRPFPATISSLAIGEPASGNETLYLYSVDPFFSGLAELSTVRLPELEPLADLIIEAATGEGVGFDLALEESQAYVVTSGGVYQVDASNATAPRVVAHHPFSGPLNPRGIVALNGIVYLGQELEAGELRVVAVAFGDRSPPEEVGALAGLQGADLLALARVDDRLYVTTSHSSGGLLYILQSSGEEMELLASLPLPGSPSPALTANGTLVAIGVEQQMFLIDVSLSDRPTVVANVRLPGSFDLVPFVYDMAFQEDLLFVTAGPQLLVIDVSAPTNPRAIGKFTMPTTVPLRSARLELAGEIVALANPDMGIYLLRTNR